MLAKMFNDMAQFLLLMVVFLAAYGISTQASDALVSEITQVSFLKFFISGYYIKSLPGRITANVLDNLILFCLL